MKNTILYLTQIFLIILFFSCQEPYTGEEIDTNEKIPVIEGMVRNDTGPHKLLLYYALPYNKKENTNISGATVYVKDDIGNTYYYHETSAGVYYSEPKSLRGQIGRSYTLFVEMPDGNILKSDPELLRDTLRIKEIIKKDETREEYYRNNYNEIITREINGQSNYAVLDPSYKEKAYYRLVSYYLIYSETVVDTMYFKWVVVNNIPYEFSIDSAIYSKCVDVNSENTLPRIGIYDPDDPAGNMELSFFVRSTDYYISDDAVTIGSKSLYTYLYTISPGAYNYYEAVNDQLNATSRMYDPLPTQLTGNMHCITDSSQVVLGYFEVSSVTLNRTENFPYKIDCYDSTVVTIRPVIYQN